MNVWEEVLARIETKVNRHSFYTWFKPTTFMTEDGGTVNVRVPSPLFRDWLTKHYAGVIGEAMVELRKGELAINFITDGPPQNVPPIPLSVDEAASLEAAEATPTLVPVAAGLNPRYSFDSFIVGPSNQFAHA